MNNSNPLISLLLPTRERPALVNRLFASIAETTFHLKQVEVVLYIDEDDTDSHDLDSADFRVVRIVGPAFPWVATTALVLRGRGATCSFSPTTTW
jgi:hypothetical protein